MIVSNFHSVIFDLICTNSGVNKLSCFFKASLAPLKEGSDLRENVQNAMTRFKEACGLASIANLKQCIRLLATRLAGSSDTVTLRLSMRDELAFLDAEGSAPDMLKKALSAFELVRK